MSRKRGDRGTPPFPCLPGLMLVLAVFQFFKARGGRHGAYGAPSLASRRMQEGGGLRARAAARAGSYRDTLRELGMEAEHAVPSRAVRRAMRMAPVSSDWSGGALARRQMKQQPIKEELEEEEEAIFNEEYE